MQCQFCGKEFETKNRICPYCRSKNENIHKDQRTVKYTPYNKSQPGVSARTHQSGISPSISAGKTQNNGLKYALSAGIALLVVLSVAAMAQSFLGGSLLSASTPGMYGTPEETIPPRYTLPAASSPQPKITYAGSNAKTLSPYSVDPNSVTPNPYATKFDNSEDRGNSPRSDQIIPATIPLSVDGFYSKDGVNGPLPCTWSGGTQVYEIMFNPQPDSMYYGKFDYLIIQTYGFTNEDFAEQSYQKGYKCEQPLTIAGRQVTYEFDKARGQTNICWRDKNNVILVGTGPIFRESPNEPVQREANIYAATLVLGSTPVSDIPSIPSPPTPPSNPSQGSSQSTAGACCTCSYNAYNRGDPMAQTCYYYCMGLGYGDIHDLDEGNDGPCDNRPGDIIPSDQISLCPAPGIDTLSTIPPPPTPTPTETPTPTPTPTMTPTPTQTPTETPTPTPTPTETPTPEIITTTPDNLPRPVPDSTWTTTPTTGPTTLPVPFPV